eukprot:SAG22_NODE_6053_length_909_cov_1.207407_2_plen_128_part_01
MSQVRVLGHAPPRVGRDAVQPSQVPARLRRQQQPPPDQPAALIAHWRQRHEGVRAVQRQLVRKPERGRRGLDSRVAAVLVEHVVLLVVQAVQLRRLLAPELLANVPALLLRALRRLPLRLLLLAALLR